MTGQRFAGAVAVVTGGGSGIGRACALALAAEGARVLVAGRRSGPLRETVRLVEERHGTASCLVADVTVESEVAALMAAAVAGHDGLDVAVNCAGLPSWGLTGDVSLDEWDAVVRVNLTGTWLCMKHELRHMAAAGGAIVNVASRIGRHMRVPMQSPYAASKSAVSTLTASAAREYIGRGVRINAVSPGPTATEMALWPGERPEDRDRRVAAEVPAGRLASPAEIAAAVLWLASPEARFVVGHDLVVDGGMSA